MFAKNFSANCNFDDSGISLPLFPSRTNLKLHNISVDVPWDDIFKFGATAVAAEFCECFQVRIDVYFPHRMYQVKPHSFPWF